jgi:AcrR family transcriptional regulator
MRQVAAACGLNVATIYHYFPSKASLLEAVIEERRYGERMAVEAPPIDDGLTPRPRLAQLVRWVIAESLEEETILRLLVGEGLRRDPTARRSATALVDALDRALVAWIGPAFPELRERGIDPPLVAHLIRRTLLAVVIEHLATGSTDAQASADELAAIVFG